MRAAVGENIIIMMRTIVREGDLGPDQGTEKTDMMTTREVEEETSHIIPRMTMITEAVQCRFKLHSFFFSPQLKFKTFSMLSLKTDLMILI